MEWNVILTENWSGISGAPNCLVLLVTSEACHPAWLESMAAYVNVRTWLCLYVWMWNHDCVCVCVHVKSWLCVYVRIRETMVYGWVSVYVHDNYGCMCVRVHVNTCYWLTSVCIHLQCCVDSEMYTHNPTPWQQHKWPWIPNQIYLETYWVVSQVCYLDIMHYISATHLPAVSWNSYDWGHVLSPPLSQGSMQIVQWCSASCLVWSEWAHSFLQVGAMKWELDSGLVDFLVK